MADLLDGSEHIHQSRIVGGWVELICGVAPAEIGVLTQTKAKEPEGRQITPGEANRGKNPEIKNTFRSTWPRKL